MVKHLSLKNNIVENLEQLQHLGGLHSLAILELEGNSIVKKDGYRKCIASALPWLQELDGESLRPAAAVTTEAAESSIYQDQTRIVSEEEEKLLVFNSQCNAEGVLPSISSTESDDGSGNGRLCMEPDLLPMSTEPPTDSAAANEEVANEILSPETSLVVDSTVHPVTRTGLPGSCSSDGDYQLDSQEQRRENSLEIERGSPASVTGSEKCIPMPPNPWRKASSHHHPIFQESVDEMLAPASTITSSSDVNVHDLVPAAGAATAPATATATAGLFKSTPNGIIPSQQLHSSPPLELSPPQLPSQPPQNLVPVAPTDPLQPFPGTLPTRPPSHGMKSKVISPLERSRQMSVSSSHNHQSSQDNVNATACIEKDVKIASLIREVDLLSAQNRALRKAINSQHEALVVRHRGSKHHHRPNGSGNNVNSGSLVCDTENDPYTQVLNCWRREVLQLLTDKEISQVLTNSGTLKRTECIGVAFHRNE